MMKRNTDAFFARKNKMCFQRKLTWDRNELSQKCYQVFTKNENANIKYYGSMAYFEFIKMKYFYCKYL